MGVRNERSIEMKVHEEVREPKKITTRCITWRKTYKLQNQMKEISG